MEIIHPDKCSPGVVVVLEPPCSGCRAVGGKLGTSQPRTMCSLPAFPDPVPELTSHG